MERDKARESGCDREGISVIPDVELETDTKTERQVWGHRSRGRDRDRDRGTDAHKRRAGIP